MLRLDVIQKIINDVRQSENDVDLPIPSHHARAEEIAKIATIDASYHSGRIIASLTLPLTERTAYDLYRLHSVAIPEKATLQRRHLTAYVVSEYDHVAVSKDQQKYLITDISAYPEALLSTQRPKRNVESKCW